ncbi:MAG TPA: Mov34/MPN/PAD-1 family protein [Thermoanaerobaculia bacterium]|nr:Mov34/MPN/PAD-1 family protein [Thermoanaerobaculia bacterium]
MQWTLLFALAATIAYPFTEATLQRDDVRACVTRLAAMSGHGRFEYESAAFLVLREDGKFDCAVWPSVRAWRRATWAGPVPDGTVAVMHTHPRSLPMPSAHDSREASRIGIPVIVVAGRFVSMVGKNSAGERTVSSVYTSGPDEATADSLADARQTGSLPDERSGAHP